MDDFLILRAGARFRQGSGISEEREIEIWSSLIAFLTQHSLLTAPFPLGPGVEMEGLELRRRHLTDMGFAVIKCGFDKWAKGLNKRKPASDVSVLEGCLKKVA